MTSQEILEKAIQQAIEGGWTHERIEPLNTSVEYWSQRDYRTFVYRHDFAKALWPGDSPVAITTIEGTTLQPAWQHHLQQMVIADDPIKYLGDNI